MPERKLPNVNLGLPESWNDEKTKKAIALALAATAAAGVYHHFRPNGKGYTYIRPSGDGDGWFNFEIGMPEYVGKELVKIRQLIGSVFSAQGDIEHLSEGEIIVKNNAGEITAEEIASTFAPDPEASE